MSTGTQEPAAPNLLTPGVIARRLAVPLHRVLYVLRTRRVQPVARAGILRLYTLAHLRLVDSELRAIHTARHHGGDGE